MKPTLPTVTQIKQALQDLAIPEKAAFFPRFFKTAKGEYGEGDQFIGVTVPDQRKVAQAFFSTISEEELAQLLASPIHEHRLTALLLLTAKYQKSKTQAEREQWVAFYLQHIEWVNNWDLVDTSCYKILGAYTYHTSNHLILYQLADSDNLWKQRIAVVATMYHIKKGEYSITKDLVSKNLHHPHDLMHKANGWLLREMGKKKEAELTTYLHQYYKQMPRTTLRYAIEKLDPSTRQDYLKGHL